MASALPIHHPPQATFALVAMRTSRVDRGVGGTTHFAFCKVTGPKGSFHPFAISRKHLEKAAGAEKGIRQQGSHAKGGKAWGAGWPSGASSGDSLLHRNLPFRVELHLKLHQAGGVDSGPSVWGLGSQPFELRRGGGKEAGGSGEQALTSCLGMCFGEHWLSSGVWREPARPQPSPTEHRAPKSSSWPHVHLSPLPRPMSLRKGRLSQEPALYPGVANAPCLHSPCKRQSCRR